MKQIVKTAQGRQRLFFTRDVGRENPDTGEWVGYRKDKWYDNVPDEHYQKALDAGAAKEITEVLQCGCLLVDGQAIVVREIKLFVNGDISVGYCPDHVENALIKPEPIVKRAAQKADIDAAFDEGIASGNIAVDP